MYQLTCSFCRHVTHSPFIRIGAVAQCPECGKIYQIGENHIARAMTATPALLDESLLVGDPVEPATTKSPATPPIPKPQPVSSPAKPVPPTLDPRNPRNPRNPRDTQANSEPEPSHTPTARSARLRAQKLAAQRQQRTLLWLLLAILLLALFIALILSFGPDLLKINPDPVPSYLPSSSAPGTPVPGASHEQSNP